MFLWPLVLLACTPSDKPTPIDTGAPDTATPRVPDDFDWDTAVAEVPGTGVPEEEELPDPDEEPRPEPAPVPIFDDTVLHSVEVTLSDDAVSALKRDPYEWTEGAITLDGETVSTVGVRLRGKIGSFRELSQKPKFKIDFNQYLDQTFQGLESLSLNNEVVDCSYLKEPTGYALYHQLGQPAPRASYARVTVNGEDYGLYVVVEVPDDTFLKDRYDKSGGNLYDGKYLFYGGYDYDMVDFTRALDDNFTLEEGEDVALADIHAITDANGDDSQPFEDRMGALIDLPSFHRNLVVEQWIGHLDGYALNQNNYRVYMNPWDGRAEIVPWDLDYAFIDAVEWGFSWSRPRGALAKSCWNDDACKASQATYVAEALALVDTDAILAQQAAWLALISEAVASDPKRECSDRSVASEQEAVQAWMAERPEEMANFWDLE